MVGQVPEDVSECHTASHTCTFHASPTPKTQADAEESRVYRPKQAFSFAKKDKGT